MEHSIKWELLLTVLAVGTQAAFADDLVIADFEQQSWETWTVTGKAFGDAPATGALPGQMAVTGFQGQQLANTFVGGDETTGTAVSSPFRIERSHIAFLVGGGADISKVGLELVVEGRVVRRASGSESEELSWDAWEVSDLRGRLAEIRIYDLSRGGWGHISVDQLTQTNSPPKRFDLSQQLAEYRQSADYMNEPLRPQYHFSPEINWMNDPNGLVWHEGEYHLFHQYNPAGNSWGHMSWGHAVSDDLVHWKHLPLAIPEQGGIMAFSGCCVVDHGNTSGFGTVENPAMVAIYTGHGHGRQVQNLAWSNDRGRTWSLFTENPVLDIGNSDFRDPKVFWHEPTRKWVMVVSLAAERVLIFYGSPNLKDWQELSRFGPAGTLYKPNWECPDLFELPVEGEPGKTRWVLEADMGSGSIAGGSGGEYFVGDFDGTHFRTEQAAQWVDFGRDFYAPVSWDNLPRSDARRIWIGWLNNWETCLIPTNPWRSSMSVPRSLSLRSVAFNSEEPERLVLVQRPVKELEKLRVSSTPVDVSAAAWPPVAVTNPGDLKGYQFEVEVRLIPRSARSVGLRIRSGDDEFTEIGFDRWQNSVYVDRKRSGNVSFHPAFAGRHLAPARVIAGKISLRILVDRSMVEVFINDGEAVISDRIFPLGKDPVLEVFAGGPDAALQDLRIHRMKSVWSGDGSPKPRGGAAAVQ